MNIIIRSILRAVGLGLGSASASAPEHRPAYVNRPPVQAHSIIPLVRYPKPVAWTGSPKTQQKKKRIARRRANAAGKRNAFA